MLLLISSRCECFRDKIPGDFRTNAVVLRFHKIKNDLEEVEEAI